MPRSFDKATKNSPEYEANLPRIIQIVEEFVSGKANELKPFALGAKTIEEELKLRLRLLGEEKRAQLNGALAGVELGVLTMLEALFDPESGINFDLAHIEYYIDQLKDPNSFD